MKTRLSNWKEESDLYEVVTGKMTDKEALKKVDEKKGINNKVIINPKLSEAVNEIGGEVLSVDEGLVDTLLGGTRQILPASAMPAVSSGLNAFLRQGVGAGLLGVVALLLNATNAYLTLQRGADRIWWNRPYGVEGMTWPRLVLRYLHLRFKALALVSLLALLIVLDRWITQLQLPNDWLFGVRLLRPVPMISDLQNPLSLGFDLLITFGFLSIASLLLLSMLPSRRVRWRQLLPSAIFLGASLTLLNLALGRVILALGMRFQAYGLIGGVLVFGFWVWLVGVLIYFSQCLGCVVSRPSRHGLGPRGAGPAVPT